MDKIWRQGLHLGLAAALLISLVADWVQPGPVFATLGWVGTMSPATGSFTARTVGQSLDIYIQVWKSGVTDPPGQGADITCDVRVSTVPYWGGPQTTTDIPMTYEGDVGNNDQYKLTLTPDIGLYEYKAFCTDLTDSIETWPEGADARLTIRTATGACNTAAQSDHNIFYSGLLHDTFATTYRAPIGPVSTDQQTVTLQLRTCMNDLTALPQIRIWDDRGDTETLSPLTFVGHGDGGDTGSISYWKYDLAIPITPTILYYVFSTTDSSATAYYCDDDPRFYGGGYGAGESDQTTAYNNSYQLTIYDPDFAVPTWMQGGVVYQVFPDRFRDGDASNNPEAGRFSYGGAAITRSNQTAWNYTVCDPRDTYSPSCTGKYGDNFYGGDLAGITEKINAGYFDALGVSVLYLNPIFLSPSNHKYDTADYMTIDPDFGTFEDFQDLTAAAHAHGMKVILDGVFNHTSSDSVYFDRYKRFDTNDVLTSTVEGTDDNRGACESPTSPYRSWFYIPDTMGSPANGATDRCDGDDSDDGTGGAWDQTYSAWWGYGSLPKLQANSEDVRDLIWDDGLNSVGPYWTFHGADGWRFDVGDDVDPGLTVTPANDYWEGFRNAVRTVTDTGKTDTLLLGELWGDASALLLGNEWDSVMNYRFRSALLGWLFTGCTTPGNGCTGGHTFEDNDSNTGSSSGAISALSPSQFNARLRSIEEDYPPMAFNALMNLAGSHDTNRVRFLLKKVNNDSDPAAIQRMKEWWLFSFTYAGSPTLYYGDEIALNHDGVWTTKWEDDPYNRAPYPWPDTLGSSYGVSPTLLTFARKMASIRWSYPALQTGDVQHGLVIDDANKLYGFARTTGTQTALIVLNRSSNQHTVTLSSLNAAPYNLPNDTVMYDAIEGHSYTVAGGAITVPVNSSWGVVLLEQTQIDTPLMPTVAYSESIGPDLLSWPLVVTATGGGRELATTYHVYSGTTADFTPDAGHFIGAADLPDFGAPHGVLTFTTPNPAKGTYYKVCAINAAGQSSCGVAGPTAVTFTPARATSTFWWGALLTVAGGALFLSHRRKKHVA